MRKSKLKLPAFFCLSIFISLSGGGCSLFYGPAGDFTGVNRLDSGQLEKVDAKVRACLANYDYINVALVRDGRTVLTKSYGHNRLEKVEVYASVSKPVTAMILLQLVQAGQIESLDDEIGRYCSRYKGAEPAEYADTPITFRHLLTHRSGVPHLSSMWNGGKLKLQFRPGTSVSYSSHGYGILGDVMEEITGKSYKRLVKEYIGRPAGAESMTVLLPFFDAPAGQVGSTIGDMALFAIAVMDGKYVPRQMLTDEVLKQYAEDRHGPIGLGWYCTNMGTPELAGFHAGSNGRPRAFLAIKPYKGNAVALTGLNRSEKNPHDFAQLTIDLMAIIQQTP